MTCTGWTEESQSCAPTKCVYWQSWQLWSVCQRDDGDCGIGGTCSRQRRANCAGVGPTQKAQCVLRYKGHGCIALSEALVVKI